MTAPLQETVVPAPTRAGVRALFRGEAVEHRGEDALEDVRALLTDKCWRQSIHGTPHLAVVAGSCASSLARPEHSIGTVNSS